MKRYVVTYYDRHAGEVGAFHIDTSDKMEAVKEFAKVQGVKSPQFGVDWKEDDYEYATWYLSYLESIHVVVTCASEISTGFSVATTLH